MNHSFMSPVTDDVDVEAKVDICLASMETILGLVFQI